MNTTIVDKFEEKLICEEMAENTVSRYTAAAREFVRTIGGGEITQAEAVRYKRGLSARLKPSSVNAACAALNKFFAFLGLDITLKYEKIQREAFEPEGRMLTQAEFKRLVRAAKGDERTYALLNAFARTGIRVSEHRFITVEALQMRRAYITNKGKSRTVIIDDNLARDLLAYAKRRGISKGSIFITRTGRPLTRTQIWKIFKAAAVAARVDEHKVFPHNLRHFFARMFMAANNNLSMLAGILGHSNVATTMVYTRESDSVCRKALNAVSALLNRQKRCPET